jgi:simple sugar transport system ATP-binding protein
MAEMMMGTAIAPAQASRSEVPAGALNEPSLKVESITTENESGVRVLKGVNLSVKPYEIVGIAGVSGNGQRELVQILAGQRERSGGTVQVHGKDFKGTREEIRANEYHVLPEMPLQNACVGSMSTAENMVFREFDCVPFSLAKWFVNPGAIRKRAEERITQYRVRPPWPDAKIGNLSGGNVQRAVLARELGGNVKVLIAANPCFGLDFKAVADIRSQIMQARNKGAAVLLVSEDLDEILELADRILVMSGGAIVYETPIANADRQEIGKHMAGH